MSRLLGVSEKDESLRGWQNSRNMMRLYRNTQTLTRQPSPSSFSSWRLHVTVHAAPPGSKDGSRRTYSPRDEEEDKGWWEKPEEVSMDAYRIEPLDDWQEAALQEAYARDGRRKMKIMDLGVELGLDRTRILHWSKEFSQLPATERSSILSQRKAVVQKERIRVERQQVAEAAVNLKPHPDNVQPGFIPFFKRKEMGLEGRKRMPADVIRTLESIYSRTPFPSNDVIKGVWELHRLSRETVVEWFVKRRESDGIKSSTQKRVSKGECL